MKKVSILLMIATCFLVTSGLVNAADLPSRNATRVNNVYESYTADEWIVSPDEEPLFYQKVDNAPECSIKGVIACYDDTYLRIDLLLKDSIIFNRALLYGIRLEYPNMKEYYIYHTDSQKFIYKIEKGGEIVGIRDLSNDGYGDSAGITNSGDLKNAAVYFIINKNKHIGGEKGRIYYITGDFFSHYLTEKGTEEVAMQTGKVKLYFEY